MSTNVQQKPFRQAVYETLRTAIFGRYIGLFLLVKEVFSSFWISAVISHLYVKNSLCEIDY
jgi:hypothetical protein